MRNNGFGKMISISSSTHKSRSKKYYLTENPKALNKLYQYREDIKIK